MRFDAEQLESCNHEGNSLRSACPETSQLEHSRAMISRQSCLAALLVMALSGCKSDAPLPSIPPVPYSLQLKALSTMQEMKRHWIGQTRETLLFRYDRPHRYSRLSSSQEKISYCAYYSSDRRWGRPGCDSCVMSFLVDNGIIRDVQATAERQFWWQGGDQYVDSCDELISYP